VLELRQRTAHAALAQGWPEQVCITAGNGLYAHHFSPLHGEAIDRPIGRIVPHPSDPTILGIENCSQEPWRVQLRNDQELSLPPGQRCNAAAVTALHCSLGSLSAS